MRETERLDVCYGAGNDVAGQQPVQIILPAGALGFGAGDVQNRRAARLLTDGAHQKAGGPPHPCEYGNVAPGALCEAVGTFRVGHNGGLAAQKKAQLMVVVKREGGALENISPCGGGAQGLQIHSVCAGQKCFGLVHGHLFHPLSVEIHAGQTGILYIGQRPPQAVRCIPILFILAWKYLPTADGRLLLL